MFGDGGADGVDPCNPDSACASTTVSAEVRPLVAYMLFDRSGSMNDDGKWEAATAALEQFFGSPDAAGLGVALNFFPPLGSSQVCTTAAYEVPVVGLGTLTSSSAPSDAHEQALLDAIAATSPGGNDTPTYHALQGAYAWAGNHLEANPSDRVVVIVVTDGDPQGCVVAGGAQAAAEQLAADELAENGIHTYAIGLEGSSDVNMDALASAGGTGEAIMIGADSISSTLVDALGNIKVSKLACEFAIPEGDDLDTNHVNVCFTPGGGDEATLGYVQDESACTSGAQWYFDDPANPSQIVLCPATCAAAQADEQAQVEVVIGCFTVPA